MQIPFFFERDIFFPNYLVFWAGPSFEDFVFKQSYVEIPFTIYVISITHDHHGPASMGIPAIPR